jgi:hypothetical protein
MSTTHQRHSAELVRPPHEILPAASSYVPQNIEQAGRSIRKRTSLRSLWIAYSWPLQVQATTWLSFIDSISAIKRLLAKRCKCSTYGVLTISSGRCHLELVGVNHSFRQLSNTMRSMGLASVMPMGSMRRSTHLDVPLPFSR